MGCESIISGLSPANAQTIVNLGIDVGTVKTTSTMMDAMNKTFQRQNLKIVELGLRKKKGIQLLGIFDRSNCRLRYW